MKIFSRTIAQHCQRSKFDLVAITQLVTILRREISIDTAPDPVAFGSDANRFGDLNPTVLLDDNVAVVLENPLVGARCK